MQEWSVRIIPTIVLYCHDGSKASPAQSPLEADPADRAARGEIVDTRRRLRASVAINAYPLYSTDHAQASSLLEDFQRQPPRILGRILGYNLSSN